MKLSKILLILVAVFFINTVVNAQNSDSKDAGKSVNQIFKEFSSETNVDRVRVGKFATSFLKLFHPVKGINGIEVLSFDECSQSVRDKLNNAIASLNDPTYETLMDVNDGLEHYKIMIKMEKETIRELVVLGSGDDHVLIRIKGKVKFSDVEKIVTNALEF
jgi:hypothetical protein